MSLTSFVSRPDVVANLKALRPPPPRKIDVPILVPPRSKHHNLVGTAFDYLLRFELKRREPHAVSGVWVAKSAVERLFRQMKRGDGPWRSVMPDDQLAAMAPIVAGDSIDDPGVYVPLSREITGITVLTGRKPGEVYHDSMDVAFKIGNRALKIVQHAQATYESFIAKQQVSREDHEELARCAIRLARLDVVYRASVVDPNIFQEPEAVEVQELIDLLGIVPFELLLDKNRLILDPTFGDSSLMIGGADADLIAGKTLVDFKTTKSDSMEVRYLDQLLGYLLLARHERARRPSFPEIDRLGLYFVRHGYLWVQPATLWTDHSQFTELEKWFWEAVFNPRPVPSGRRVPSSGDTAKPNA